MLFFGIRCIISCRCARFDHLCDYMIELSGVSTGDYRSSEALFQIPPSIPGNRTAGLRDPLVSFKTLRLFLLRKFPRGDLGKLVERQLCGTHVIA